MMDLIIEVCIVLAIVIPITKQEHHCLSFLIVMSYCY